MFESDGEEVFTTWTSDHNGGEILAVHLCGELDASTAPSFLTDVRGLAASGKNVVLDVALLSYIDSTGVSALLSIAQALARHGKRMALAGCHGILARILDITSAQSKFACYADVDSALAELRSS